jgi:hypothetical protein
MQARPYDSTPWNDDKTLSSFRNEVEGWHVPPASGLHVGMHNLVHLRVGGKNGTMLPSTSPNDPAFFLHHANIDRLWSVWQQQQLPFYAPQAALPAEPGQGLNEPMIFFDPSLTSTPPWSDAPATPASVIDHRALGYVYDTDPPKPEMDLAMERNAAALLEALKQYPLQKSISGRDPLGSDRPNTFDCDLMTFRTENNKVSQIDDGLLKFCHRIAARPGASMSDAGG